MPDEGLYPEALLTCQPQEAATTETNRPGCFSNSLPPRLLLLRKVRSRAEPFIIAHLSGAALYYAGMRRIRQAARGLCSLTGRDDADHPAPP